MIVVNGQPRADVAPGLTVTEIVRLVAGIDPGGRGVAVAVGAEVVPRGEWDRTVVEDGARVEVLGAVQGG